MNLFAVIPVKPFAEGKSRLADILPGSARIDLNRKMFEHVLEVVTLVIGAAKTIVVSADQIALDLARRRGARAVREKIRDGLNPALQVGARAAADMGADAVLILPTDLPTICPGDVEALASHATQSPFVIIAPDRSNRGTNALLISPPDAIEFFFGEDSFAVHCQAARSANINPELVHRDGLAFDIDTPADYHRLATN